MTHSHLPHPDKTATSVRCAIITVSDTRTEATDKSGQIMQSLLSAEQHCIAHYNIIPDDPALIADQVKQLAQNPQIQAVLLNGGTGIAPRDTTYDAIAQLLTKTLPGFGEIFRQLSYTEIGSRAIASRAIAGIRTVPIDNDSGDSSGDLSCAHTLIFSVPGSSKAVSLAMKALIIPELIHLTQLLKEE